ncbi:hypothetical protein V5E97_15275 [Singulisphaera sp. Ch08]|uniref:CDP-glycerol--glycerophosphate glycerophosphotransferase n=1 Tax=Singulisphaera sp. Ch08 TaxID=3120278 RepID=A0AAU7CQF1_9BACT
MTFMSSKTEGRSVRTAAPGVVVLSSSLLTDRMLLFTRFLDELSQGTCATVWATTAREERFRDLWDSASAIVEPFPAVRPFREFPHNYLRRFNEYVWDFRQRPPSRLSMMRHVRKRTRARHVRALELPARVLARLRLERPLEDWLERLMLAYPRSPEALSRLKTLQPAALVTTGPFRYDEPAIVAVAKNLRIPTLALITSWDNLSTKARMVLKYDGYLLWSEQMRRELLHFYPDSARVPSYVVGAPQFDAFFQRRFQRSREEFCASQGLEPQRPLIVYALGSPNFLREHHGAAYLAERVARGDLGNAQLLIRPHPVFDNGNEAEALRGISPQVIVQRTGAAGAALTERSQDEFQITEWVNTFRHADVVVNLSSTVVIDAAIFDRPVVNLNYDPEPGRPNQALVKDANHRWTHFKPVAESGGVWLVNEPDEMVEAVKGYLQHPELHRAQRRWIVEYVCGRLDGSSGERMAAAVLNFIQGTGGSSDVASMPSALASTVGAD